MAEGREACSDSPFDCSSLHDENEREYHVFDGALPSSDLYFTQQSSNYWFCASRQTDVLFTTSCPLVAQRRVAIIVGGPRDSHTWYRTALRPSKWVATDARSTSRLAAWPLDQLTSWLTMDTSSFTRGRLNRLLIHTVWRPWIWTVRREFEFVSVCLRQSSIRVVDSVATSKRELPSGNQRKPWQPVVVYSDESWVQFQSMITAMPHNKIT